MLNEKQGGSKSVCAAPAHNRWQVRNLGEQLLPFSAASVSGTIFMIKCELLWSWGEHFAALTVLVFLIWVLSFTPRCCRLIDTSNHRYTQCVAASVILETLYLAIWVLLCPEWRVESFLNNVGDTMTHQPGLCSVVRLSPLTKTTLSLH